MDHAPAPVVTVAAPVPATTATTVRDAEGDEFYDTEVSQVEVPEVADEEEADDTEGSSIAPSEDALSHRLVRQNSLQVFLFFL